MIKLDSGLRTIEVTKADGSSFEWQYDVVAVKLLCEELQATHGITETRLPNRAFLDDLAPRLFEGCTVDAAYRICHLVNQQFQALHNSLTEQLQAIQ